MVVTEVTLTQQQSSHIHWIRLRRYQQIVHQICFERIHVDWFRMVDKRTTLIHSGWEMTSVMMRFNPKFVSVRNAHNSGQESDWSFIFKMISAVLRSWGTMIVQVDTNTIFPGPDRNPYTGPWAIALDFYRYYGPVPYFQQLFFLERAHRQHASIAWYLICIQFNSMLTISAMSPSVMNVLQWTSSWFKPWLAVSLLIIALKVHSSYAPR